MPRIRTIKPEFPQSESVGRLSRDARLLFLQLWTLVDDEGRARGSSRILASLLYPFDDDALKLMDGWVGELEQEGCVRRYTVNENTYVEVCKWLKHQKIDKPSPSRIPANPDRLREDSRKVAPDLVPVPRTETSGSEKFQPSVGDRANVVVMQVMQEAPLSGMKVRMAVEDAATFELRQGRCEADVVAEMLAAWRAFSEAKPNLEYIWGAEKFFGEGNWKDQAAWPWKVKNGSTGKDSAASRTPAAAQRQSDSHDAIRAAGARRYGGGATPTDGRDTGAVSQPSAAAGNAGHVSRGVGRDGDPPRAGDVPGRTIEGNS